jgi:hypothetical protein
VASGNYSFAAGRDTEAFGESSFSGGNNSFAYGKNSFAFGKDLLVTGEGAIGIGTGITQTILLSGAANATSYTLFKKSYVSGELLTEKRITSTGTLEDYPIPTGSLTTTTDSPTPPYGYTKETRTIYDSKYLPLTPG